MKAHASLGQRWQPHLMHLLAFLSLWLLFDLPLAVRPDRVDLWAVRPTGELLVLLTLAAASVRLPGGQWIRRVLVVLAVLLVLVRVNQTVFFSLMRSPPLLYDQLYMAKHLFVLVGDLWDPVAMGVTLASVLGVVVLVVLVRRLLRVLRGSLEPPHARTSFMGLLAIWGLALFVPGSGVQWLSPALAMNAGRSMEVYRSTEEALGDSTYAAFSDIRLRRRPDVHLYLVESYGRLVQRDPALHKSWSAFMRDMESAIAERGYQSAGAFSTAPVSGGRSWLAEATVLTGVEIRYEAFYRHLAEQLERVPNLVSFLRNQGYRAVLLTPADRPRAGVELTNPWGYDRVVGLPDLGWSGPRYGWGIVPDQYSLGFTHERILAKQRAPLFFNFHMVSSHAPWTTVPELVQDWRALADERGDVAFNDKGWLTVAWGRLRRYQRERHLPYEGRLTATKRDRYESAVLYSLATLREHILSTEPEGLILIMGDHQPPLVAPEHAGFEVPVHLISRDPTLLAEALSGGFQKGMFPAADDANAYRHAGLFSLLVRTLASCCGDQPALPAWNRQGVALEGDRVR